MRVLLLAFFASFFLLDGASAQGNLAENDSYFVVIGAFSNRMNANRLVRQSKKFNLTTVAELNKIRGLYYVYVLQTGEKPTAVTEAMKIRGNTPYTETWVFTGTFKDLTNATEPAPEPVVEAAPVVVPEVVSEPAPPAIDPEKQKHDEIESAVQKKSMKLVKGETETLNFIYFFRDAAILRPESRFEVERLVKILNDHPEEKIRIHGHTNGSDWGKIIKLKDGATDFFSLDNTVEDYGSAVLLSELRADIIMDYLVSKGIDKNRMSIKAWGGKKPLYQVDDEKAEANVRVEIEVLNND